MKKRIQVSITTNELSSVVKEEMWHIYRHYYHYSKEAFLQRIQKNNYYSFYKVGNKIVGFTGLRINKISMQSKSCLLVYFGQTVIDKAYRGKALIPMTGVKIFQKFWKDFLFSNVYYWADALTYKAYLVFAKSVEEYYPTYKKQMPASIQALVDHIGQTHYSDTYDPATGTVKKDTIWVNDHTCKAIPKDAQDPDVLFYGQANPLNSDGHGLLTITPMNRSNLLFLIKKVIHKQLGLSTKRKGMAKHPTPVYQMTESKTSEVLAE